MSIKALAKRFGTNEMLAPAPFTLEEKATLCGVPLYRFASEEYQTGLSWMGMSSMFLATFINTRACA